MKRVACVLSGAALLLWFMVLPVSASPPRRCLDGQTISHGGANPLIVDDVRCTINQVNVGAQGAIVSGQRGRLNARASSFAGPITLDGVFTILQLTSSTVHGDIDAQNYLSQSTVTVLHSAVHGNIQGESSDFTLRDASVDGSVGWTGHLYDKASINSDRIGGDLGLVNEQAIVQHTTVGGELGTFYAPSLQMCDVHVHGPLRISSSNGTGINVEIGAYLDPSTACTGPVVVDGDVYLEDNLQTIDLHNLIVHGDLNCSNNRPAPIIGHVEVTGKRTGQCAAT